MNNLTETRLLSEQYQQIFNYYTVEELNDIEQYLNQHPQLIDILLKAPSEIRKYFPSEKLRLKLYIDPESPEWQYLIIGICANSDDVDETLNKLDNLNEKWWNHASRGVAVNLSIDVEFA